MAVCTDHYRSLAQRVAWSVLAVPLVLSLTATLSANEPVSQGQHASVDFLRDVVPVLSKAGCNGGKCHGSFQGRGGFRLSLFGFDANFDREAIVHAARGRRVSVTAPEQSLLLRKPLAEVPHAGGRRFGHNDANYQTLRDWIAAGMQPPRDPALHVVRLQVEPTNLVMPPGQSARLAVTAEWSDQVIEDVTDLALFESRDESRAEVDATGHIQALRAGRTSLTVSFMGQVATVSVTSPYEQSESLTTFTPRNYIDELVSAEWRLLGLWPAEPCDDATFARRVFLDLIGTLPTVDEVRAFVASTEPDKRAQLIESLLAREEYVDHWSHKWADLLRVHRRYVGDKGLWSFWSWVREMVRENWSVDRLTRELLTARGSLFSNGATAYYFVDGKPEELAETTSQLFLGVRLQCARCHHHPYEVWSQEDYYGLANFFTRLEIKDNADSARFGGTMSLRPLREVNRDRRVAMTVPPRLFGEPADLESRDDVRTLLAEWITATENPFFTRNFVNRYWSYLMGRGLVEPVDDLRATNPASHPELLEALNADFVRHGLDTKHLLRTICNSQVYQLAAVVAPTRDQDGMFYTHRRYARLPATVMLDAVNQVCGTFERFPGMPQATRAAQLPDPQIPSYFLDAFGRSVRSNPCECATSNAPDLAQALHFINSTDLNAKISAPEGRLHRLLQAGRDDTEIIEDLYVAAFGRSATAEEQATAMAFVGEAESRQIGFEDLLWTLLNSTGFVFNH